MDEGPDGAAAVLHLPLSDVAVLAQSPFSTTGCATAIGEQPVKGLIDPAAMGRLTDTVYRHDPAKTKIYNALYAEYLLLHDYFGRGENDVMKRLRAIREQKLPR